MLNVGDMVGGIYRKGTGSEAGWELVEDRISRIVITKRGGRKYHTLSKFRPLCADDIDSNTKSMEDAAEKGYIITQEIFGLNEKTRPFAENWVKWANENMDKASDV